MSEKLLRNISATLVYNILPAVSPRYPLLYGKNTGEKYFLFPLLVFLTVVVVAGGGRRDFLEIEHLQHQPEEAVDAGIIAPELGQVVDRLDAADQDIGLLDLDPLLLEDQPDAGHLLKPPDGFPEDRPVALGELRLRPALLLQVQDQDQQLDGFFLPSFFPLQRLFVSSMLYEYYEIRAKVRFFIR